MKIILKHLAELKLKKYWIKKGEKKEKKKKIKKIIFSVFYSFFPFLLMMRKV